MFWWWLYNQTHMVLFKQKSAADTLPFGCELLLCIAEALNEILPRTLTLNWSWYIHGTATFTFNTEFCYTAWESFKMTEYLQIGTQTVGPWTINPVCICRLAKGGPYCSSHPPLGWSLQLKVTPCLGPNLPRIQNHTLTILSFYNIWGADLLE